MSAPRRYLDSLARLMDTDRFVRKRQLTLLFRRSQAAAQQNIGDPAAIKNRAGLLILIESTCKKHFGGYISVEISSFSKQDSICDYQAFIFSLTHNTKMKIMKGE